MKVIRSKLLDWFQHQKRDLPWRETKDPYKIWLSEIMLQQTRVETVKPYYKKFLQQFPQVQDLAAAPLNDVLSMWSGLGYYRRAKNLHKASIQIMEQFEGKLPSNAKDILSLAGIGRYTSGAILSIAFEQAEPIVDGNVQRVFARLFLEKEPVGSKELLKKCWKYAEKIVVGESPGDLNQAIMELGALICTPKSPTCMLCPLQLECKGLANGSPHKLPTPKAKKKVPTIRIAWAKIKRSGKLLMLQRPSDGLFADMWELPGMYSDEKQAEPSSKMLHAYLKNIGLDVQISEPAQRFTHKLTHRKMEIYVFSCNKIKGRITLPKDKWHWVDLKQNPSLPISSITNKIIREKTSKKK